MPIDEAQRPRPDLSAESENFYAPAPISDDDDVTLYGFLTEGARELDSIGGDVFRRLLAQPDIVRRVLARKAKRVAWLLDPSYAPSQSLRFLASNVGFDGRDADTAAILERLTAVLARRLIRGAISFWRRRGRLDALVDVAALLCGVRPLAADWNSIRGRVGVSEMGISSLPGYDLTVLDEDETAVDADLYRVFLVVPDFDGTLDRTILESLCRLSRPIGERIVLLYVDHADDFGPEVSGNWDLIGAVHQPADSGALAPMLPGMKFVAAGQSAVARTPSCDSWRDYALEATLRWHDRGHVAIVFYYQSSLSYYAVKVTADGRAVSLYACALGIETLLAGTAPGSHTYTSTFIPTRLRPSTFGVKLSVSNEGGTNIVRVHVDGDIALEADAGTLLDEGTCGFVAETSAPLYVQRFWTYQYASFSRVEVAPEEVP